MDLIFIPIPTITQLLYIDTNIGNFRNASIGAYGVIIGVIMYFLQRELVQPNCRKNCKRKPMLKNLKLSGVSVDISANLSVHPL